MGFFQNESIKLKKKKKRKTKLYFNQHSNNRTNHGRVEVPIHIVGTLKP